MHIGFCGPASLTLLQDHINDKIDVQGYPFRGSATLIREYLAQGHRVTVFTTSPDINEPKTFTGAKLRICVVPSRKRARDRALDFFAVERRMLLERIVEEAPDVLHANWTYEFGLAARKSGLPSIVTVHDWAPSVAVANKHPYWYFRLLMQIQCLAHRGIVTAPSEYIARRVTKLYRLQCQVIPNGIDTSSFLPRTPRSSPRRIGMLNVGFSDRKNTQRALRAWSSVRQRYPEVTLVAAGPGYERGCDAWRWAQRHGFDTQVEFIGAVEPEDIPAWFDSLDVFLHPSLEESFGMVILEAMSSGLPVIAGEASGAVPEITGGNAFLTRVTSTRKLAQAIDQVLADHSLRIDLAAAGTKWSQQFELPRVAKRYLATLETTLRNTVTASRMSGHR